MTFYLKYRPQTVAELDSTLARERLTALLQGPAIPHALLFTGPRGIGKTSSARIVAKAVNCPHAKKGISCNRCPLCLSITQGNCVDVIEMDAASHRGIEDAKELIAGIKLVPSLARMKVYIIDEAHMLTTEASNVLLKTLEEPPGHVLFILATTNREKLIPTILSRVVEVKFNPAGFEEMLKSLERIVKGEKLKLDKSVLDLVVKAAQGSFRDGAKLLEQVVVSGATEGKGAKDLLLGADFSALAEGLLAALHTRSAKEAVLQIEKAVAQRVAVGELMTFVIGELMRRLGDGQTEWLSLVDLLMTASIRAKDALLESVPYEIAIIKWCMENEIQNSNVENQKPEDNTKTIPVENDRWNGLKDKIKATRITVGGPKKPPEPKSGIGLAKNILLQS